MEKNYKFSKYNHIILKDGYMYGYNALTGGLCKFNQNIQEMLEGIDFCDNQQLEKLDNIPPNILDELKKGGFIINECLDEFAMIKSRHLTSRYSDNNSLGLTILPTLACNFRCSYCFEADKGYENLKMSDDIMESILDLIDKSLGENGKLHITWFGGEPLLGMDVIIKLQTKVLEIVKAKNLLFSSAIITNGYLLSKEISEQLVSLRINLAQVTIDGTKETHDKQRFLINGKPTFEKIISNSEFRFV